MIVFSRTPKIMKNGIYIKFVVPLLYVSSTSYVITCVLVTLFYVLCYNLRYDDTCSVTWYSVTCILWINSLDQIGPNVFLCMKKIKICIKSDASKQKQKHKTPRGENVSLPGNYWRPHSLGFPICIQVFFPMDLTTCTRLTMRWLFVSTNFVEYELWVQIFKKTIEYTSSSI